MDTRAAHREITKRVLTEYAQLPYAYGDIKTLTVFDETNDHYLLVNIGWDERRVHGCLVHVDLIEDKIWIQRDDTEDGIACDLEAAGIPKDHIVLAFHPIKVRPYTGYAVA
jgi:hypothetical protein